MGALADIVAGSVVDGLDPRGPVTVIAVQWMGDAAAVLTYRDPEGAPQEHVVFREDEDSLTIGSGPSRTWQFDGHGQGFRLAAEARRIQLAHLFDPYLALESSEVDPLPHQIEAVYGEMLPRQPLRFLLADDPGAGKTIMAGLYLKELMVRGDCERCLIVAPGSLVNQWQDELRTKFGLRFDILTKEHLDALESDDIFEEKDQLIARVDQLARRDEVVEHLRQSEWDLVVVDEAHRMSAHFFSNEIQKTKRFRLGEVLGLSARHFLLMTATPHAGKEEDYQLFLSLLDNDRFEGRFRDGVHAVDTSDIMRRMVKEKLLTFEGKPLFPERRAHTISYELSDDEMTLYDEVTDYVREQMNRADRLVAEGQGRRGNTVGFALTLLQRRLASSPEAIYQSLRRRRLRLEARIEEEQSRARVVALGISPQEDRLAKLLASDIGDDLDLDAWDELGGDEQEELEVEVVDAATAAATVAELETEIGILAGLERIANGVRASGEDRKWLELSELMTTASEMVDSSGARRKLIIFTEHRDTLSYLVDRLRTFLGQNEAVVAISGSTPRDERRAIQARFTQDEDSIVLVATDAAGEGVNLQRAHLVVNYDLPWNPNRIEQRFGRVHRIGQTEVCHMWNLVAEGTRESDVHKRLLDKIENQRKAYQGQVFDVLGEAMSGTELRGLLIDAIRYGDDPEVRARIERVIDHDVESRIRNAIEDPPLADETIAFAEVERIRVQMEEAAARRLQPHYVQAFFEAAFADQGGKLEEREPGRFQIRIVPAAVRGRDRQIGRSTPVLRSYERITFERDLVRQEGAPLAELIAPGHPLLASVLDLTLERHRSLLTQGTVLVDESDGGSTPRVLVMLEHAIADGRQSRSNGSPNVVSQRYEMIEIPEHGDSRTAGYAPYLDYRPLGDHEQAAVKAIIDESWLDDDLEAVGVNHAVEVAIPDHLAQLRLRIEHRVDQTVKAVKERLTKEINYWDHRANELQLQSGDGKSQRLNVDRARQRADELADRLQRRLSELEAERSMRPLPPKVVGGALVVPAGLLRSADGNPPASAASAAARSEVEARAIDAVLSAEDALGWSPTDMNDIERNHPGYDIRSVRDAPDGRQEVKRIEVKGRVAGAPTVTVTRNEILTSLNDPVGFILALVEVGPDGVDRVRYLREPFRTAPEDFVFEVTSINFPWKDLWDRSEEPS